MRINQFVARSIGISRREANQLIDRKLISLNGSIAEHSDTVSANDKVTKNGQLLILKPLIYLLLNKPVGYVTSRKKQGTAPTIYKLIPKRFHDLKPVGRLDKDSCGLLLLTNDGALAQALTHPSNKKQKSYLVKLDKPLTSSDQSKINKGVKLEDGKSSLKIKGREKVWIIIMSEGKKRQIRRTFDALGYQVKFLQRTAFGPFNLKDLKNAQWLQIERKEVNERLDRSRGL